MTQQELARIPSGDPARAGYPGKYSETFDTKFIVDAKKTHDIPVSLDFFPEEFTNILGNAYYYIKSLNTNTPITSRVRHGLTAVIENMETGEKYKIEEHYNEKAIQKAYLTLKRVINGGSKKSKTKGRKTKKRKTKRRKT